MYGAEVDGRPPADADASPPLIAVRVQHHPSRADLMPDMLSALSGLPVEVVEHSSDPPSPWAGYRRCLADPPACSHLLIVQDDAVPVPNFAPALEQVAAVNPDIPVCLFLGRLPLDVKARAMQARKQGRRYLELPWRGFMPVVAVLWPRDRLLEFSAWADDFPSLPGQREPRSDDAMAGMWKMRTRQRIRVTVPSLVEHPDEVVSTIGKQRSWGPQGRVALFLADDALAFDWSQP